jgi:hypothetical protein
MMSAASSDRQDARPVSCDSFARGLDCLRRITGFDPFDEPNPPRQRPADLLVVVASDYGVRRVPFQRIVLDTETEIPRTTRLECTQTKSDTTSAVDARLWISQTSKIHRDLGLERSASLERARINRDLVIIPGPSNPSEPPFRSHAASTGESAKPGNEALSFGGERKPHRGQFRGSGGEQGPFSTGKNYDQASINRSVLVDLMTCQASIEDVVVSDLYRRFGLASTAEGRHESAPGSLVAWSPSGDPTS